jgi:hypothetical protein
MNKLLRNSIFFIYFWSIACSTYASVTIETNRNIVSMGETVNLTIKVKDENTNLNPNLDALKDHFNVVNSSEQTQIQIINGKASSLKQWIVTLEPKEEGSVTIPALQVGDTYTEPLTIEVTPASEVNNQGGLKEVFLKTSIEPESPYVSSQAIYTVQVYYRTDIQGGQLTEPSADNSMIKQIGEDSNYQKSIEGYTYHVLERHYAVVADKSGPLKIQAPILTGYIIKNDSQRRSGMLHWMNSMMEPMRITTNSTGVDVKPMPDGINYADWLPAKALSVTEEWSGGASSQYQLGQPITRTITIEATGITSEKLPEINLLENSDVLVYPDKPQLETTNNGKDLLAKKIEKLAIIPTKTGDIHLPAVNIKWWNVDKGQFEIASLPEHTIRVIAVKHDEQISTPLVKTNSKTEEIAMADDKQISVANSTITPQERFIWICLVSVLLLLWGLTFLYRRKKNTLSSELSERDASELTHFSIRERKQQFKLSALKNQPKESKFALIAWSHLIWPNENIRSLGDIEKLLTNSEAKGLIRELDQCLYTNQPAIWNGKLLWEILDKEMHALKSKGFKQSHELPELYLNP